MIISPVKTAITSYINPATSVASSSTDRKQTKLRRWQTRTQFSAGWNQAQPESQPVWSYCCVCHSFSMLLWSTNGSSRVQSRTVSLTTTTTLPTLRTQKVNKNWNLQFNLLHSAPPTHTFTVSIRSTTAQNTPKLLIQLFCPTKWVQDDQRAKLRIVPTL